MSSKKVLIIGEVYTDFHSEHGFVQLGGIFHAARTLNAISCEYGLAYIAPQYLDNSINKFSKQFNSVYCKRIGFIQGCPNVLVIKESTEAGTQGYNDILRSQFTIDYENNVADMVRDFIPTDLLIFPGKLNFEKLLYEIKDLDIRIHIDFQYGIEDLKILLAFQRKIETAIFSTSLQFFLEVCNGSVDKLLTIIDAKVCNQLLLKENRGGSRFYEQNKGLCYSVPSFPTETVHSVGVGDCFNSILIALNDIIPVNVGLRRASYISSFYASTWDYEDFLKMTIESMKIPNEVIEDLEGVKVDWEKRKDINIYLAAPDFPDVNTRILEMLYQNLNYHNFNPHLPVRENGLVTTKLTLGEQSDIFLKDIILLENSQILIAVLLYNDPGTLVELGYFAKAGKPTILFDPYKKAHNLFLRKIPTRLCHTLSEVTDVVFELSSKGGQ